MCLSTARIDGEKKRTKSSRLDSIRLQKYEIKIPRHEEPSSRRAFFAGGVWPKHIFDIGFLFGSRIAHAVTTATRGDSLASSPPPSAAKISLSCLFPTFLLSLLSLKGSLFTSLHPLSFPRSLLLMDYVSPSLSIYRLSLSLSISICFLYRRSVYGVSQKQRVYDE